MKKITVLLIGCSALLVGQSHPETFTVGVGQTIAAFTPVSLLAGTSTVGTQTGGLMVVGIAAAGGTAGNPIDVYAYGIAPCQFASAPTIGNTATVVGGICVDSGSSGLSLIGNTTPVVGKIIQQDTVACATCADVLLAAPETRGAQPTTLGTPTSGTLTNMTGLPLTSGVLGILPVLNGGTGTATPALVAGTGIGIVGTWPNQTISSTASAPTFTSITSGTNVLAAMIVGTGASLTFSGTGTINASSLGGVSTITPSTTNLLVGTATANVAAASSIVAANVVQAVSPGVGVAHFAGGTQTATSSLIVSGDLSASLSLTTPNINVATGTSLASTSFNKALYFQSTGTTFTASGCTNSTLVGGATAGTFKSGTTGTCTVTITMGGGATATTGWSCNSTDRTTANLYRQTASTTTTATFSGTTTSADIIQFACTAF